MRRQLAINESLFMMAFARDVDYHDHYPQVSYLDLETGEMVLVFEDDEEGWMLAGIDPEENKQVREEAESAPERYLEVPGLDHGDHHDLLREFLNSDWTDDEQAKREARAAYSGSIGRWKQAVAGETVYAFHAFRESWTKEMGEEFLRGNGIEPTWR